jgi:DNA-binding NarL/FixJ family response regulator
MASLLLVTDDPCFAAAAEALSNPELIVTRAQPEEAVALARQKLPDILAIDADSIVEAKSLIATLSLVARSKVVALACQAWPGSEAADALRHAGADTVLPKPSGLASPTLAGADRDAYRQWLADLARPSGEHTP